MIKVQQAIEQTPSWVNWLAIVGSAALSFLQPVAALIAIVWGGCQIWSWCANKRWRRVKRGE